MTAAPDPADPFEALGRGALRGPEETAWELFERAWPGILRRLDAFERSLGVPAEFLEDCGQAVLLRVWRFRAGYRGHSAAELAGWMHMICRNEAARYAERAARAPRAESDLGARGEPGADAPWADRGPVEGAVDAGAVDPTEVVGGEEDRRALEQCLAQLEARPRAVVELLFGAEASTEREAAALLGRSKSYVNDLRRAGLDLLARCLKSKGVE